MVNRYDSNNIIIFGASGYVGNYIRRYLDIKKCTFVSRNNKKDLNIDINEYGQFKDLLINSQTTLILLSAISSPDICFKNYQEAYLTNVVSTSRLIDFILERNGRVIFLSSDVVYGNKDIIFNEESLCNPLGKYAEMKRIIELKYINEKNVKIIRPSYIFSLEDKFSKYIINSANKGKTVSIYHPLFRNIIFIGDLLEGIIKLVDNWDKIHFKIVNFGGDKLLSRKDIANFYKKYLHNNLKIEITNPPLKFYEARPKSININSEKLEIILGRKTYNIENLFINNKLNKIC